MDLTDLSTTAPLPTPPRPNGRGLHPEDPSPAGPEGEEVGDEEEDEAPDTLRDPPRHHAQDDGAEAEDEVTPAALDATDATDVTGC